MNSYKVQLSHETKHLKALFKLASFLKSDIKWLVEVDEPEFVVIDDENLQLYS